MLRPDDGLAVEIKHGEVSGKMSEGGRNRWKRFVLENEQPGVGWSGQFIGFQGLG